MRALAASALLLLLAAACRDAEPAAAKKVPPPLPAPSERKPEPDYDADNLLNLAYGATVVDRTGELNFEYSTAHPIDGLSMSFWSSPPGGAEQTMTFALAAASQVEQIGVTTNVDASVTPKRILFEISDDGRGWRRLGAVETRSSDTPQLQGVTPTAGRFIRVTTVAPNFYVVTLRSIHAIGSELAPAPVRDFSGCWSINGSTAVIRQEGARLRGVIASTPPTFLDGGTDGRVARFMWTRGAMWGYSLFTASADAQRLTGLEFHEEIDAEHLGFAWIGERCGAGAPLPAAEPGIEPSKLIERSGRFSLFGLAARPDPASFEAQSASLLDMLERLLTDRSQRFRVTAHEARGATAEENQKGSAARLQALRAVLKKRGVDLSRVEFVAAGGKWNGAPLSSAAQRLMVSRIDVERIGP